MNGVKRNKFLVNNDKTVCPENEQEDCLNGTAVSQETAFMI